ncbi:hypothetical protein FN846DRAFT_922854 [Sphaerosporella brunnea]|uniref:Uncharacterized protein n=1 Tax=Sphaerosporella brunnea TaxID=1250544 RepID=A0A5J5EIT9_9PEZI|nr:hypothetical protein FN846DRAFT_922854 [Sphaerosporella brunnea]
MQQAESYKSVETRIQAAIEGWRKHTLVLKQLQRLRRPKKQKRFGASNPSVRIFSVAEVRDMVVRRDEDEAKKAREALERAQTAIKRAARAERKQFLDAVKESRKKILASSSSRKKLMKALFLEVRKEGRKRAKRSKQGKTERM